MKPFDRASLIRLILICLVATAIRLTFLSLHDFQLEGYEWNVIAQNLLDGRGYRFNWEYTGSEMVAFGFPGMPFVLFSIYKIFGVGNWSFIAFQMGLTWASIFLLFAFCKRMGLSPAIGFLAALIFSFEPGLIVYGSRKIHDNSLLIVMVLFLLHCWTSFAHEPKWPWTKIVIFGFVTGLGLYVRSTLFLFFPIGAIWLLATQVSDKKHKLLQVGAAATLSLLVLSPWVIRNQILLGKPIIESIDTFVFWRGNNAYATGSALDEQGNTILQRAGLYEKVLFMEEMERREFFAQESKTWFQKHPAPFFIGVAKKFFYFWWFSPQAGSLYPKNWIRIYKPFYGGIFFLSLWGMFCFWRLANKVHRNQLLFLIGFIAAVSILQAFYYVEGRHRLLLLPLLLPFTSVSLENLWQRLRQRRFLFHA